MAESSVGPEVPTTPAPRPERTILRGRYVDIVPLETERHAAELYPLIGGAEHNDLWTYLFDGPYETREAFNAYIAKREASTDPMCYAIVDTQSQSAVGMSTLMRIDQPNRVIEIGGIIFSPALQRTRGATEAMYLLARYIFELGYRRYEWKCHSMNQPSRKAALRFGFQFEGIFRQHMILKGRSRDTAWYSMIDADWPVHKAEFERWLAPSNFDASGAQRTPLAMPRWDR